MAPAAVASVFVKSKSNTRRPVTAVVRPMRGRGVSSHEVNWRRKGCVSVWVGAFPALEAAEVYFGIPDEIGVYLPPEGFANDLGLDDVPIECLEVNFEQSLPRPLRELLQDATFSAAFIESAVEEASRQGIHAAQGIALLYDFDYQANEGWQLVVGPLRFIGSFPFVRDSTAEELQPRRDPRIDMREIVDDVL